jgi:uncharacterized protein (TIGR02466 family)
MSTVNNSGSINLQIIDEQQPTIVDSPQPTQMEIPKLEQWHYFPSVIYTIDKPEFLDSIEPVSQEYLDVSRNNQQFNDIYPVYQTQSFQTDPRVTDFVRFIGQTSWDILAGQGYNMAPLHTFITELWCQEHLKFSGQEEHLHGHGNQISGFYFLQVPDDAPRTAIFDPRPAKQYANLPETDMSKATYASHAINFLPKRGQFMFMNSWLPHGFTKNPSEQPFRFIHFNIGIIPAPVNQQTPQTPMQQSQVEIV